MSTSARPAAIAALLLVLAPAAWAAGYRDAFRNGVLAARRGRWADAERLMKEALAEKGSDAGEVIVVNKEDQPPYVPHYFLGLAYLKQGNCAAAMREWQISESEGIVQKSEEYATLRKLRTTCPPESVVATETTAPKPPPPQPQPVTITVPVETTTQVATATTTTRAPQPQPQPVQPQPVVTKPPPPQPQPVVVATRTDTQPKPPAPVPTPKPPVAPPWLVTAVRDYFAGRYDAAIGELHAIAGSDPRARSQALLIRAASAYSLYLLGGEKDDKLRAAVLADIRACRAVDPALVPARQYFSPRFVTMFTTVR